MFSRLTNAAYHTKSRAGFRHVEVQGQPLCGMPHYLKDIKFKIKEIL